MRLSVGIVDYGTGNIASLVMALDAVGAEASLVSKPEDLVGMAAVILPGVGHFRPASLALHRSGLAQKLCECVSTGLPVLGICLGFQLLTISSEEAPGAAGLGLLPGMFQRLRPHNTHLHKVPHMGWNTLEATSACSHLLRGIAPQQRSFYFANAYAIEPDPWLPAIQVPYNHEKSWLGLVEKGPICGVQFHPEKSREQGLKLLHNFMALAAESR
jgi:imidazole glycerol-phosphate synthase subunit HisH